jgi:TetR/AcrR family transcriptional repressor of nem operon
MCLCGMLAAEYTTLPRDIQDEVTRFFDANEAWVSAVLAEGRRAGELTFDGAPKDVARLFVGSLEGAMLIARSYGDVSRLESAAHHLLGKLRSERPRARPPRTPQRSPRKHGAR